MKSVQRALQGGLLGTLLTIWGIQTAHAEQGTAPAADLSTASTPATPAPDSVEAEPAEAAVPGPAVPAEATPVESAAPAEAAPAEVAPVAPAAAAVPLAEPAPAATVSLDEAEVTAQSEEGEGEEPVKENHTPAPFRKGNIALSLGLGWASSGDSTWTILGVGGGYFVVDGLKAGLNGTFWIGDKPFVSTLTPELTYIMTFVPVVQPYVGALYRHYFVSDKLPDTDSIGARAGVLFVFGPNVFMGGGVLYEHFLDDDVFVDRDYFSPEIIVGFSF